MRESGKIEEVGLLCAGQLSAAGTECLWRWQLRLKRCSLPHKMGCWTQVSPVQITSIKSQLALDVDGSLAKT